MRKSSSGFTIVELLIVIVVIAILATISIVAYTGIQNRAKSGAVTSALNQAAKKITLWQVDNPGQYPSAISTVGLADTNTISYQYSYDNNVPSYCLTATYGTISYYISNSSGMAVSGVCSGYNLITWNKSQPGATPPIPSATVDSATYRTSIASMRLGPAMSGRSLRDNPYGGASGQTYTVTLWVKTDSNWDGSSNNSKIRFGDAAGGNALLGACGYGGVKTVWTQVTCSYMLSSTVTQLTITVGNDGTVGNVWFDDVSLTLG
jgi:prepilin-type N-terminal cleavage/methylation domain-containing protein